MDWWEDVQKIYERQGHVVIAALHQQPIGLVFYYAGVPGPDGNHTRGLPQPFRIIAPATREEFFAQTRFIEWPDPETDHPPSTYYYKAVTE